MSNDITTSLSMNTNKDNSFVPFLSIVNDFSIYYSKEKKGIVLDLGIETFLLKDLFENKDKLSYKCFVCKKVLDVFDVIIMVNKNIFGCKNCLKDNKTLFNLELTETEKKLIGKFDQIIANTNQPKDDKLFKEILIEFNSIKNFTSIILFNINLCSYYDLLSKRNELYFKYCSQIDLLLEMAIKNKEYYDIYSFVNECFLFGKSLKNIIYLEKNVTKGYLISNSLYDFIIKNYAYKSNNNFEITKLKKEMKYMKNIDKLKFYVEESLQIINEIKELKNEDIIIENKANIFNLKQNTFLTQYYESYFKEPNKLILNRKSANSILYEIIIKSYNKLCEISPTKNMIERIINEMEKIKNDSSLSSETLMKLNTIKSSMLKEYGTIYHYYSSYKKEKVERPYVNFTEEEINNIKELLNKKIKYENPELKVKDYENNKKLQISIDFLYYLKKKGNIGAHILGKDMLKFQKFQKNYFANNQNEDINYLIINETQIKEVDGKVKLSNLIDYIFNPNTEDIYDSKNKVDFIIKKFSSQFKALTNENIILKNIIKDYEEKINNIKNLIINTINSLFQFEDKWKSYENIFSLKNNFNNLIKSIRKAYNNKYELKKLLDDSQKYGIKCQKFILYYAFKLIYNKIMENKDETFKELDKLRDNIINNYTKIEIMKIIDNFITQLKFNKNS